MIVLCVPGNAPAVASAPEQPAIRIIRPNGGEILDRSVPVSIVWTSSGINEGPMALILYSRGVKALTISSACVNSGRFDWEIPRSLPPGNHFRIRIRWIRNPAVNDFSDADFTIPPHRP